MTDVPMEEVLGGSTPAQFKALAHPFRQRLLIALDQRPATISQLAVALAGRKGNVAHHLKVLRAAGMVRIVETRQVRGGTEQYYQRTARRFGVASLAAEPATAMLQSVAKEIASATDNPLLALRHLRLTADQVDQLTAALTELVANARDAGDDQPTYGLLVSLYRQPGPELTDGTG